MYYPILFNDFLYWWDDQWQVMNHYTEGGINFDNLWAILTEFFGGQYSPVDEYMYLFIFTLFEYNPMAFHLASLLLHAGSVCLVYIIIIRIAAQSKRIKLENASTIAFIAALLFAIHPLNVEAIAWISASKIVVYAFFYLAATYTCLIYLDKKKNLFYILTLILFAFYFGGKEQAVTFPLWLLMLYWLSGYSLKERKVWMQVTPFFVLAIVFGLVTMFSQAANGSGILLGATGGYPLWQRFVFGCYAIIEYIVKFVVPFNLLYIYPFPMVSGEPLPSWMLFYPALIIIVLAALWKYITQKPVAIGLVFFLIHIALVLHIIPLSRFVVIADRYIYLACIGLAFIFACYFVKFVAGKRGTVRKAAIGCFLSITLILSVYSNIRSRAWKDTDSIKRELRELLEKRDDYVPPPEVEKLMQDDKKEDGDLDKDEEKTDSEEKPEVVEDVTKIKK